MWKNITINKKKKVLDAIETYSIYWVKCIDNKLNKPTIVEKQYISKEYTYKYYLHIIHETIQNR